MPSPTWYRRAVPLLLAFGLAAPAVGAAQGIEEPRIPLRTALAELNTLRTEYVDAFNAKDAATVTNLYSSDAILVLPNGMMIQGDSAIRAGMTAEAPTWPHAVLASDTVSVYGNTAVDVGTWTTHPAGGGEEVVRYMTVLRRNMNGWKITRLALTPVHAE